MENEKHDLDTLSQVTFMDSLLDKQTEIRNLLDVRSNIVIGFNSALIVILVTYFKERLMESPALWVLLATLILSLFLAIVALKPPHYHSKKGQKESLFYHHYIDSKNIDEYRREIHQALENKDQIFDAYITEVYNITKYSNVPRKFYLYSSLRVLIYGIGLVILVFLISFIYSLI